MTDVQVSRIVWELASIGWALPDPGERWQPDDTQVANRFPNRRGKCNP